MARAAMLLKSGISPHTITCLTFSSRGAEDLRRMMENQPMTAAEAPHMFIGTIHHYASFYLRRAGYSELGISPHFTIWDQEQAEEIMTEILDRKRDPKDKASSQEIRTILEWYGKNQTRGIDEAEAPEKAEWVEVIGEYNRQKRENNTLGLEDLIPPGGQGNGGEPGDPGNLETAPGAGHLLVDEFQDMTPRQIPPAEPDDRAHQVDHRDSRPEPEHQPLEGSGPPAAGAVPTGPRRQTEHPDAQGQSPGDQHAIRGQFHADQVGKDARAGLRSPVSHPGWRDQGPTLTRFRGTVHEMDRYILNSAEQLVKQGYQWEDMACIYRRHQTMNRMITQFSGKSIPHNILGDTQRDQEQQRPVHHGTLWP